jgi:hypothetical protein
MNILGLVFSILLILAYGYYACWDKQGASSKLRNTYTAHEQVSRKILNSFESQVYASLGRAPSNPKKEKPTKVETEPEELEEPTEKSPNLNRECACINLWPLIQEGREKNPILYELAAKLIRTFYGSLSTQEKRFEYYFLDVLIESAKKACQNEELFSLEKVNLTDPDLQRTYYKMLKGTKRWDLRNGIGYPPLLDYVKAAPSGEKICVFHAHPDLITVLFNEKIAWKLYSEIHRKDPAVLTKDLIEKVSAETHHFSVDIDLLNLLQLGRPDHKEHKKVFLAEDTKSDVALRKNLFLDKML